MTKKLITLGSAVALIIVFLMGCEEPTSISALDTALTLTIDNKTVTIGTADTLSLAVGGGLTGVTDYTLSITGPSTKLTILDNNDGTATITIPADIAVADGGEYTVTATGQGRYAGGTVEKKFTLTIDRKELSSVTGFTLNALAIAVTEKTANDYDHVITVEGGLTADTDDSLSITTRPLNANAQAAYYRQQRYDKDNGGIATADGGT